MKPSNPSKDSCQPVFLSFVRSCFSLQHHRFKASTGISSLSNGNKLPQLSRRELRRERFGRTKGPGLNLGNHHAQSRVRTQLPQKNSGKNSLAPPLPPETPIRDPSRPSRCCINEQVASAHPKPSTQTGSTHVYTLGPWFSRSVTSHSSGDGTSNKTPNTRSLISTVGVPLVLRITRSPSAHRSTAHCACQGSNNTPVSHSASAR